MERDFTYLREKYKVAGAREVFEDICAEVLALEHGPEKTHQIRVTQGDGGIDVLVGDFSQPAHIFQCKFFEKLEDSQKIRYGIPSRLLEKILSSLWTSGRFAFHCRCPDPRWNGGAHGRKSKKLNIAFPFPFWTAVI
jgi:hypothetical protein